MVAHNFAVIISAVDMANLLPHSTCIRRVGRISFKDAYMDIALLSVPRQAGVVFKGCAEGLRLIAIK